MSLKKMEYANPTVNYLDLFSGIGGFHLGIERAGININQSFYSEIDKYANSVYLKHFKNSIPLGDVIKINAATIQDELRKTARTDAEAKINLITFGFSEIAHSQ